LRVIKERVLRRWNNKQGGYFFLAAALLLLLGWAWTHWYVGVLELKNRDTGKILFISLVQPGDEFSLWFINSQDRFPMAEVFRIQVDYGIHLAFIDTDYEIAGNPWAYSDIKNIDDKRNNPYIFFSGSRDLTQHTFIYKGYKIPLWREPHQLMEVNVTKIQMSRYLLKCIIWRVS
jgi:hypothetical protein